MSLLSPKDIQWLFTDIDGVWTDCCIYYSAKGEEFKKFNYRDGMGVERLRKHTSIQIGIITGENSPMVARRAEKLKIDTVFLGVKNKLEIIEEFIREKKLSWENIAYIGDDLNDLDAMNKAGMTACPADAFEDVYEMAQHKCKKKGGEGAFREFCEILISKYKN